MKEILSWLTAFVIAVVIVSILFGIIFYPEFRDRYSIDGVYYPMNEWSCENIGFIESKILVECINDNGNASTILADSFRVLYFQGADKNE